MPQEVESVKKNLRPDPTPASANEELFIFWEGTKDDSQSDSQSDQIRRIRE
jgi:hypothetical protein